MKALLLILLMSSCVPHATLTTECKTEAIIIGYDYTRCRCCGGWIVIINDERFLAGYVPGLKKVDNRPDQIIFNRDTTEFPLKIRLNYQMTGSHCHRIKVNCIAGGATVLNNR